MSELTRVCQVMGMMNGGGVEQVVMELYRHIDRNRYQFDFIVTEDSTRIPYEEIQELGGNVFIVPSYKKLLEFSYSCECLFMNHPEWHIAHSHMNALSVFPLKMAAKVGVPVRIAHNHSTSSGQELVRDMAKNVLRMQANKYPTFRMACTEYAGKWLFGDKPFTVLPNPIDAMRFAFDKDKRKETRDVWGVSDGTVLIGNVGRLMEQKNQMFLISILAKCIDAGQDVKLAIVGDGSDKQRLIDEAERLGVSKMLIMPGFMDTSSAYSAFDVFCFPSLYEGLGMAPVEAQMSGLPCVVSKAVPDEVAVTENCEFIGTDDAQLWADEAMKLAERGRHDVDLTSPRIMEHDPNAVAEKLTDIYDMLIVRDGLDKEGKNDD